MTSSQPQTKTLPHRAEVPTDETWDLANVYPTDDAWTQAAGELEREISGVERYRGKLRDSAEALAEALRERDRLRAVAYRLYLYASMQVATDGADQAAQGRIQRAGTLLSQLEAALAYIEPELLALDPAQLGKLLADSEELTIYQHYFEVLEGRRSHVRSAEVEAVLAEVSPLAEAPYRTYNALSNTELRFEPVRTPEGEIAIAQSNAQELIRSADRETRRQAWQHYADGYLRNRSTLANTVATAFQRDSIYARAHNYPSSLDAALDGVHLPRQVFENLIAAVRAHYPLWHRYWDVKRRALGVDQLHDYDTLVPLVRTERAFGRDDARELVLTALAPLGSDYTTALRRGLYEERWVDWARNQGKSAGAFSTGAPGTRPFLLLSYGGTLQNVSTLAHELGHSMHTHYTSGAQPVVYHDVRMFVAETASNFNQALWRAHLLRTETDPDFLLEILSEAMSNYHRYFFIMPILSQFEVECHAAVDRGEGLTADRMSDVLLRLFRDGYGANVAVDDARTGITWAQFSHMFANFYVYQYALGIAAANALADGVIREGEPAARRYIDFLKAGDSLYPLDALRIAGVDLRDPEPINRAFAVLEDVVNRLDQLVGPGPLKR